METLGTCPLRYFYRYVLRISPPDDPRFEPDVWLGPLHRGSLLHAVYEGLLRAAREEGLGPEDPAFEILGRTLLASRARRMREEVPPPSEAVHAREMEALEQDVLCFAAHLRRDPAPWTDLERAFGATGEGPVQLEIGDGTLRLRGAVDRVDQAGPDGSRLRIIDYKTGAAGLHQWGRTTGVYHGGRRLQHLLYALALEALEGRPVESVEYHFPTRKGEGEVRRFARARMEGGESLLLTLLEGASEGLFVPTEDVSDCRFCDYRPLCRVQEGERGPGPSPAAAWGRARMEAGDEAYQHLRRARTFET
jgi:ATP-dependent helicase/nuclease subunit B